MKAIENGLKRFEKGTRCSGSNLFLKGTRVKKSERLAMSLIYERLKNNTNNEIENGVTFSKIECDAIGLTYNNDFGVFYLDRRVTDNKRVIIYFK
jgi:hypothetical protein